MTSGVLVDTHIVLWSRTEPEELTDGERRVIDAAPVRYVSCVTLWEFGILIGLGRIEAREGLFAVPEGYELLPISAAHCRSVSRLPRHHRDPFDRMLVAQAQTEQVALLTRDRAMLGYADHATILRFPEP
jgi:PIN domain nuclease of toxin-antitoxin system